MKRALFLVVLSIVPILLLYSCKEVKVKRLVSRMMGTEITIPKSLELMNAKFIADSLWLVRDDKYKLVITISNEQCTNCRISVHDLIDSLLVSVPSCDIAPMVVLSNPDEESIRDAYYTIEKFRLSYPIYLDISSRLFELNPVIPDNPSFQSFLLDRDDRIVLVGDPSLDYNIMKLYQKVLRYN